MPFGRNTTRTLEEIVQAEDSNDDDYDDAAPRPSKSRSMRTRHHGKPVKKKQRRDKYDGSDVDEDEDDIVSDEEDSFGESEEEQIETNHIGRPVRKSAKKAVSYEDADSDEDDLLKSASSSEGEPRTPPKRRQLIIKLKTGTPRDTPNPAQRNLRTRSGNYSVKQPASSTSQMHQPPARRSSRLSHDEEDAVVALSSSGKHVEVIRAGSRDPEDILSRAFEGGKGMKYPSKSTIDEEPESSHTKNEDEEELEIKASQHEVMGSEPRTQEEPEDALPRIVSDIRDAAAEVDHPYANETSDPLHGSDDGNAPVLVDEEKNDEGDDEEDEDEAPISRARPVRAATKRKADSPPADMPVNEKRLRVRSLRSTVSGARTTRSTRGRGQEESSDFEPEQEQEKEDEMSDADGSDASPQKHSQSDHYASSNGRRSNRLRRQARSRNRSEASDEDDLHAEVEELKKDGKKKRPSRDEITFEPRRRRGVKQPNYDLLRTLQPIEDEDEPAPSPSQRAPRKTGGGGWQRSLLSTYGPFGGGGGLPPVLGGPGGPRAQGDVDSDSSDDEGMKQPKLLGGTVGMTPTTAGGFNLFPQAQPLNNDTAQGAAGTPANLGKIKDKQALADADPLGVDQNVNFDGVGGLQGHIDQLKEMVTLPLLYPEIFMRFHITPPRGVLFHGPPGTGKTLLARALASSVSSNGRKVTFYMRKGADALSKWVGEAEKQLRLLFEEARRTQPSIIFFDEIDGLAPVRSSKQDQIHASIVSTLLALMDGMDGRGQVIVIGATNRPDSIDPALRRPGRFDREFYFPLPNTEARRAILDIHTKGWEPPLDPMIKDELADLTKGYGGADLRALCTEATLNAVQRRYPQIYKSKEKLLINPKTIEVMPKDFMISIKKMVPSSERSATSGAKPLQPFIEPLLRRALAEVKSVLEDLLPQKKRLTALQEAEFEDFADGRGFGRERMQQAFEQSRVFRPRLLIHGKIGMGQQYLAAAVLNNFEGLHVQAFDLPTLLSDSAASPEATVIRLFAEVKRHKPSVIYIPNVQDWYSTLNTTAISTFLGLLRSIDPTDPVLLLGVWESEEDHVDKTLQRDLFGYSRRNQFQLKEPLHSERLAFFEPIKDYVRTSPLDFPEPEARKKRALEVLPPAPVEPEKPPTPLTKEELKAQKQRDRHTLNLLKIRLQPIMDQIRTRYKKFRTGVIDESQIRYLYDEADPGTVTSDQPTDLRNHASFRPFEIGDDGHGVFGLVDQSNNNFYYNLDSVTIEKRLSNGYYIRPKDFQADIKRLAKDAKTIGDEDRLLKANELLANVEVDVTSLEYGEPTLTQECERVYERELARRKELAEKAKNAADNMPPAQVASNVTHGIFVPSTVTTSTDGPITTGVHVGGANLFTRLNPQTPIRLASHSSNMTNGVHGLRATIPGNENPTGVHAAATTCDSSSHNGVHEADVGGDTPMGNTDSLPNSNQRSNQTQKTHTSSSFDNRESAQPRPIHSYTAPSQQLRKEHGMEDPLSQTHVVTSMPVGSQAADFHNDASTTRTTQSTNKKLSSGEKEQHNTQDLGPDLYLWNQRQSAGGSDIPDTQGTSCQGSRLRHLPFCNVGLTCGTEEFRFSQGSNGIAGNSSQPQARLASSQDREQRQFQPPVPPFNAPAVQPPQHRPNGHIQDLLNPDPQPNLVQVEEVKLNNWHRDIADRTSGLSVEQLEQVNSVLMDTLWKTRNEWDRGKALGRLVTAFNDVVEDMKESGQEFGDGSWGRHGQQ